MDAAVESGVAQGLAGVVLVTDAKATTYARAVGLADVAAGRPHRLRAVWPWASVTKEVTSALVMQEVAAGWMSLEAPVSTYLPAFKSPNASATLRQLLQHTSGLPNPSETPEGAGGVPGFYLKTGAATGNTASALGFCAGTPQHPPGGPRFDYNNCDYLVLGAALERVTGQSYARLVKTRIAEPIHARSLSAARDRVAPYGSDVTGYDEPGKPAALWNLSTLGAGGALGGTAEDLAAFDRALLTFKLVPEAQSRVMWEGDPKLGYVALGVWGFSAPLKGCTGQVELVERRGEAAGVEVRNVLAPKLGKALIVLTNNQATPFGEVWQGKGLSYDLLSAAFCH
ncbi:hypothetical protein BH09PSE2_BH09PSE2_03060 [soil metagenome]